MPPAGSLLLTRMPFTRLESPWEPAPRPTPPGSSLFAIGDVHGHAAHLDALLELLAPAIAAARAAGDAVHLVLIGDYVDRGPATLGVLDRLLDLQAAWGPFLHLLCGNHDRLLSQLLARTGPDATLLQEWRRKGGATVLRELRVPTAHASPRAIRAAVREGLGARRQALLAGLTESWLHGEWLFVHAGIHPERPLEKQPPASWLTMREPFLSLRRSRWRHGGLAVVHGHTVRGPEVLPHRVAIDSGVYRTGVLTALELKHDRLRFRCVADRDGLAALAGLPGAVQGRPFTPIDHQKESS